MTRAALDTLDAGRWRRVEAVLDTVLELEPGDVAAHLASVCGADPGLRREVEALLEADRRALGFMNVPAAALMIPLSAAAPADDASASDGAFAAAPFAAPPPERLGRYRVMGELGRGGMGVVYLGRDEALGRTVAIKALPGAVASDPERLAWFLTEAKLLGMLHHPNVAAIHGVEQAEGRHFLILERIEGHTLAERLRAGPLPLDQALDLGAQVAEALAAAHAHGILHRDLKPGNLMLTPGGLAKVLDFGLARQGFARERGAGLKSFRPAIAEDPANAGGRLGTPGYMSPEQILGRPEDARVDLFALGSVLYQCLTGERAFGGASSYAVITASLSAPVDFSRLPAAASESIRALLAQILEKDPERRLGDARVVASVLRDAHAAVTAPAARVVVAGDPIGSGAVARARARRSLPLPAHASPFIGRAREIEDTLRLLARARLVTLTGHAGCGKTRLAIEIVGASHGVDAADVWHADLSSAADDVGVAGMIAAAAGVRAPTGPLLVEAMARHLDGRPALLVLDHCERTLGACAALAGELLAGCPELRILATSREWLGVPSEQTLRVAPLSLPDPDAYPTADSVQDAEAVQLFVACARRLTGAFQLTDANAAEVAGICRAIDGVPLAIEVTAALLCGQSTAEIAAALELRLQSGIATAPGAGDDALAATIRMSYERLMPEERGLFRALSAFSGGWSLESAAAVCGEADEFATLDLHARLLDKSLIAIQRVAGDESRYRFLEPVRRFAASCREEEGESVALTARHVERFLALAERAAPALLSGSDQARWLARLEADHANLLQALASCETMEGGAHRALRISGAVWLFWYMRGHFARGREALARALALPHAAVVAPERAQALYAAGGLAAFQDDHVAGRTLNYQALEMFRALGDRLGVARSLSHLALCEAGEGRFTTSRRHYEEAIEVFSELGDGRRLSAALNNLGVVERRQGDLESAFTAHERALDLVRRAGDRDGTIATLVNLALVSARLGRAADAARRVDEALAHAWDLRARRSGAAALEVAAVVLAARGGSEDAARLVGAAHALRAAIGMAPDLGWREVLDPLIHDLRAALGDTRFEHEHAAGGRRSFEPAIDDARRQLAALEPRNEPSGETS